MSFRKQVTVSRISRSVAMLVVAVAGALLCARAAPAFDLLKIEPEAELRMGREVDRYMHAHCKFSRNPLLRARLVRIGDRLVAVADPERAYEWHFQVTREEHLNMVSSCAGYVYATRGIMAAALSDDDLAGVLAHELAHVMMQHVAKSYMVEYQSLEFNDAVVDRAVEDMRMYRHGQAGPFQLFTIGRRKMVRDFEREADTLGVGYAARAGFDALGHARALRLMIRSSKAPRTFRDVLLLTHPPRDERIRLIEQEARRLKSSVR